MEKNNTISVWAGNFQGEAAFLDYVTEAFDDNGDPICSFWQDFDIDFIDSNFQEALFFGAPVSPSSFAPFSYAESFPDDLSSLNLEQYNSLLLVYDFEYDGGVATSAGLSFVGSFPYQTD